MGVTLLLTIPNDEGGADYGEEAELVREILRVAAAERERIRLELLAELARLHEEAGPPPGKGLGNARDGFAEALQAMELFARRLEPKP